ncbi:hypothetical protein ACC705_35260, partial [Rhizobium ruizarguesonis]
TLTITDPTQGVSVNACDVDDPDEADTESKAGKDIDVSGWSYFLDAHLERGADGAFVKENGSSDNSSLSRSGRRRRCCRSS